MHDPERHNEAVDTAVRLALRVALIIAITAAALILAPQRAGAVTVLSPTEGAHLPWMQLRPVVAFDVADNEKPKWVLIATDAGMTRTVRYCRTFGSTWYLSAWHWGCDAWAIGADPYGNDILRPLEWNTTYYSQVVYTDADGHEKTSAVRSFAIDNTPTFDDPGDISDQVWGSVMGDGTNLNLGAAAFVNSGLKVTSIRSARRSTYNFSIGIAYSGGADLSRSYVRIISKAGVRYLPVKTTGEGSAAATWKLTRAERKLRTRRFRYQAFIKSTKNGALVKSEVRVVLIRRIPHWRPIR